MSDPATNPEGSRQHPEGIRAWYNRNTRKAIRGLIWATVILLLSIVMVWIFVPLAKLQHAQTFNGALTIPGFGGLWIASFMFIWLIPMREVSFRGQESMERMEEKVIDAVEDKIVPAIETWQRIGTKVERELIPRFERFLDTAEKAVEQLSSSAKAVESFQSSDTLQEIRDAAQAMKQFATPQGAPPSGAAAMRSLGMPDAAPGNGAPAGGTR